MPEQLPHVPPGVGLLVTAISKNGFPSSEREMRKRIRDILPELRRQSELYQADSFGQAAKAKPTEFDVYLDGGLDLFSRRACQNFECRMALAERLTRSVGLIADHIWVTDNLTSDLANFGRVTNAKLDKLFDDGLLTLVLFPLIAAGILKFRPPAIPACQSCIDRFETTVESITDKLLNEYAGEVSVVRPGDGTYRVHTGALYEPSASMYGYEKNIDPTSTPRDFAQFQIYTAVHGALWAARDASLGSGVVFSNSRVGIAGLQHQEGRAFSRQQMALLDNSGRFAIPWVSELSPVQVLQLRQEASQAMPKFREKIAGTLNSQLNDIGSSKSTELLHELRHQAAEVRAELEVIEKSAARYWKTGYAVLGLGLSAFGVATDQVVPAVGGLLPILQLLINHKSGHEKDVEALKRKPGYVLVKAQDLLAHTHN